MVLAEDMEIHAAHPVWREARFYSAPRSVFGTW